MALTDFTATPLSGSAPLLVQFTDTSSGTPIAWEWNYGDGSPHSYDQNPSHTYSKAGTFSVTLTLNSGASTITKIDYVTVAMACDFSVTPVQGVVPLVANFTDLTQGEPDTWVWDFGDSITSIEKNPVHVYSRPGVYTVKLTASKGSFSDTERKIECIKINFVGNVIKYAYIVLSGRLATEDVAPPISHPELRVLYAAGSANYLFIKKGIRVIMPEQSYTVPDNGFTRDSGPSLIFD